jgi:hypothetical protein
MIWPGMGFGKPQPSLGQDLTTFENVDQELAGNKALENQSAAAAHTVQGSVEQSLLNPLTGTEPYLMNVDPYTQGLMPEQPQPNVPQQGDNPTPDPVDDAMKYLDSSTTLSLPGYEVPTLPPSDPFISSVGYDAPSLVPPMDVHQRVGERSGGY